MKVGSRYTKASHKGEVGCALFKQRKVISGHRQKRLLTKTDGHIYSEQA